MHAISAVSPEILTGSARMCMRQVSAVAERTDASAATDFLNKRGANVKWCSVAEPPSEREWHTKGMHLHTELFIVEGYSRLMKVLQGCFVIHNQRGQPCR